MIGSFIYSLTKEDYITFEKMKVKQSKTNLISYFTALFLLVIGVFNAVSTKNYTNLIIPCIFIVATVFINYYAVKIRPKKVVNNYTQLDKSYFGQKKITVNNNSIEIEQLPSENGEPSAIGVYPYSAVGAIFESKDYYQIIMTTEATLIPKRDIPQEIAQSVENTFKRNPNYVFMKNV